MKSIIIYLIMGFTMLSAQDAAGQYKLTGVDVMYTFITRAADTLTVTDAYGLGITQAVSIIPAAVPFTTQAMQLTDAALSAVGINLNVTLNEGGSGSIAEGSYYPDVNTIEDENGACVTLQQVLPVTDNFTYTSSGTGMADNSLAHPGVNVLGLPGISGHAGEQLGLLGLSGSNTFEDYPMVPSHPTLCGPDESCFDFIVDVDGDGQIDPLQSGGNDIYQPGGTEMLGVTGGFFLKNGLNAENLESVFSGNTAPDFMLEWHGVDGISAGLGCGSEDDCMGSETEDEDGDGTWWDRQIGIPAIPATYMNSACGFTLPIYGDVTAAFDAIPMDANQDGMVDVNDLDAEGNPLYSMADACIDRVDVAASGYLMDPSGALATWGHFLTANAATYAGTAAFLTNLDPLAGDVDPAGIMAACGATGETPTNPTAGVCLVAAGATGETPTDVDVLTCLATATDETEQTACVTVGGEACVTACATADVAAYVAASDNPGILADDSDHDFDGTNGRLTMNFDVPCVPVIEAREVVAEFIEVGDNGGCMVESACNYDATATIDDWSCIYGSNDSAGSDPCYESEGCAYDCDVLSTEEFIMTDRYSLDSIYPNPFNPNTTIGFTMPVAGHLELKVYDIIGRELVSLKNEYTLAGTHSVSWNASSYPSGVYIVKMDSGTFSKIQKIVLMK